MMNAECTHQTENASKATFNLKRNQGTGSLGKESQKGGICSHVRKNEHMKTVMSTPTIQLCHHCLEPIPMSQMRQMAGQ